MKILLVEDDLEISELLRRYLTAENYQIVCVYDGDAACRQFETDTFDLVLLDLMIPKRSGLDVMRQMRRQSVAPIIILSAKDADSDKVLGLGLGADDYITKPFSLTEVLARVQAILRRSTQWSAHGALDIEQGSIHYGALHMDLAGYSVTKGAEKIELTAKEFDILKLFLQHPKRVYTKQQIYALVWEEAYLGDENAVNVHISRLRNKIEDNPRAPKYIITVWGIGYKLGEVP